MDELPDSSFDTYKIAAILMRFQLAMTALVRPCPNQVLRNISCRCHHAIGGNAGGEYELPHSFTAKGSHTILVLIENNRDASRVVNFVLFSIVGPMLPEETDRSKVAENVHALGG